MNADEARAKTEDAKTNEINRLSELHKDIIDDIFGEIDKVIEESKGEVAWIEYSSIKERHGTEELRPIFEDLGYKVYQRLQDDLFIISWDARDT